MSNYLWDHIAESEVWIRIIDLSAPSKIEPLLQRVS
jgi:hypothetical protein